MNFSAFRPPPAAELLVLVEVFWVVVPGAGSLFVFSLLSSSFCLFYFRELHLIDIVTWNKIRGEYSVIMG